MSRTVNPWQYLPPFLKEFKELDTLFSAERPEFQTLVNELDELLGDFFIQSASEKGIARYEKLMGIRPNVSDSLETRRNNALTRWYDRLPFTARALKERLEVIQGNNDIDMVIDNNNPSHITIYTHMEVDGQIDNLYYILNTMLPANMECDSINYIGGTVKMKLWYGVGATITGSFTLTDDLDCNVEINGTNFVGMANSTTVFINQ